MNKQNFEAMLQNLPEAADAAMGGLTATPFMKAKIDRAVAEKKSPRAWQTRLRPVLAMGCMALAVLLAVAIPMMNEEDPGIMMHSGELGEPTQSPDAALSADLGSGDVRITKGRSTPGYRSIWSDVDDGYFPLIGVNGKFYRMLTSPRQVDSSLMGEKLGTVSEFTREPSLSDTSAVLSNAAAFGSDVYAISGMGDALVCAEVNGTMRLFQRVSFNGNALRGRETLADTLQLEGRIIAMELSGVGTITDPATCETLLDTLLQNATMKSNGSLSSKQALLLETDTGLVLQMNVRGDSLAACGVWSCPEFFEAFEEAMN